MRKNKKKKKIIYTISYQYVFQVFFIYIKKEK